MTTLWINTGELSGDMQAASVLRAMRKHAPDLRVFGMGGPELARAGQKNLFRIEDLSVMGFVEIFSALPRALRILWGIRRQLKRLRPDAVLLVDAPEFNFRVVSIARSLGIPVYYFIPPKVWAWRTGRVAFLRRHVQRLLCILPFEKDFYRTHGLDVEYVGNPLVDLVDAPSLDSITPIPGRVGVMAGSRMREVRGLMPLFGETARHLLSRFPHLTFHCLRAPNMDAALLRSLWPEAIPHHMEEPEQRYREMKRCTVIMAASGTAVLETALVGTPTVLAYTVSSLTYFLGKQVVRVRWAGLPNLIMNREVFPEFIQKDATPENMAARLGQWLSDPAALDAVRVDLSEVSRRCGEGNSAERAAACLLRELRNRKTRTQ